MCTEYEADTRGAFFRYVTEKEQVMFTLNVCGSFPLPTSPEPTASYVESLTPKMMIFGDGGDEVLRVEPSQMRLVPF